MLDKCKTDFKAMLVRIESVIKDRWPETLKGNGELWTWLDENRPELRKQQRDLTKQLNEAWENCMAAEFKTVLVEWGRVQLEIYKGYALHLRGLQ